MAIKIKGETVIDNFENLTIDGYAEIGADITITGDALVYGNFTVGEATTLGGALGVGGHSSFNGGYIYGNFKKMVRHNDSYLRLNPDEDFTDGISLTGNLTVDGTNVSFNSTDVTFSNDVSLNGNVRYEVDGQPFCPIVDLKTGWTWDSVSQADCPSGGNGANGWWLKDYNYATIDGPGGYTLKMYTSLKR